jgi:hypothetical protein
MVKADTLSGEKKVIHSWKLMNMFQSWFTKIWPNFEDVRRWNRSRRWKQRGYVNENSKSWCDGFELVLSNFTISSTFSCYITININYFKYLSIFKTIKINYSQNVKTFWKDYINLTNPICRSSKANQFLLMN